MQIDVPWLVWGDFNAIYKEEHRFNGSKVTKNEMINCVEWMSNNNIYELKSIGRFYSYSNNEAGKTKTLTRIDHTFGNVIWMQQFGDISVHI